MNCPDCTGAPTMVFDAKQMGEVCPKCTLVISMWNANPNHKHYATEKGFRDRLKKDKQEKKHRSVSTAALVDRILNPID